MADPDTTIDYWQVFDIMFDLRTRRPSLVPQLRLSSSSSDEGATAPVVRLPEALEGVLVVEEPPDIFGLPAARPAARPGILESLPIRIKNGAIDLGGGFSVKVEFIPMRKLKLVLIKRF